MIKIYKKALTLNKLINKDTGQTIISCYKRASNILDQELKNPEFELSNSADPGLFKNDFEKKLYKKIQDLSKYFVGLDKGENYELSLTNLAERAKKRRKQLMTRFQAMKDANADKIKEVRGKGLLTAFEMHNEPHLDGHHVSVELLKRGVYAKETHHSTVRVAPALTISTDQIDQIADAIDEVMKSLLSLIHI